MFTRGIVENDAHPPGLISTAKPSPESLCWLIAAETKVKVEPAGSRHVACDAVLRSKPRHDAQLASWQRRSVAGNCELSAVKPVSFRLSPVVALRVCPPGVVASLFVKSPRCEVGCASMSPRGMKVTHLWLRINSSATVLSGGDPCGNGCGQNLTSALPVCLLPIFGRAGEDFR